MHPSLRRLRPWLLGLVLALLGVGGWALARARGPAVRTVRVRAQALEQHVVVSGRVWVPARVQVSAQTAGLVVAVGAVEGQRVRAGDLLVQLDDAEARAAVAQARAAVGQARARVEQLRRVGAIVATEALRQAEANLARAAAEHTRARTLAAEGALSQAQLDEARRAEEVARAQRAAAEAQQLSAAPMGAESRAALAALLQAQAQLTGATARLDQARVTALQDGTVLAREVEPGDVVQPARTLLVLAADAAVQLEVQPDERNLSLLALGQRARAAADAYPQQPFDAEVGYIAPAVDPRRGSIAVRLHVPRPPPFLRPDMTVSVDLTVASRPRALTLPAAAVREPASPEPWVWAVEDGRVRRRPVTLGLRGEGTVEVARGLAEGAQVVLAGPGPPLSEGQRVRAGGEEGG